MTVTSVREEKLYNPRLTKSKEGFIHIMENLNLPYPAQLAASLPANLACGLQEGLKIEEEAEGAKSLPTLLTPSDLAEIVKKGGNNAVVIVQGSINAKGTSAFAEGRIPGALLFDVEVCSDPNSPFSKTLPTKDAFEAYVNRLGAINNASRIVIYDGTSNAIMAAARVWWMFRVFGHDKVSILDGGLEQWKREGHQMEMGGMPVKSPMTSKGKFVATFHPLLFTNYDRVIENIATKYYQIVDARSPDDHGAAHIPQAKNMHFKLVTNEDGRMKSEAELKSLFQNADVDIGVPTVAHCVGGLSCCIVGLAAFICGKTDVAIYDGSWSEWSSKQSG
jgi:thiosulfate/3-mercaptopyruvate sulfurtransferase